MNIYETLSKVQKEIVVPKNRTNKFGGYNYRNAEDIMEAAKKACYANNSSFFVRDEIIIFSGEEHSEIKVFDKKRNTETTTKNNSMCRFYVKATATFVCGDEKIEVSAFAREPLTKKGMDEAQVTGAASSYARKYALCGLFGIDGQDDPDAMDNREETKKAQKATAGQIEEVKAYCAKFAALKEKQLQEIYTIICQRVSVSRLDDMNTDQTAAALSMLKYWCDQAAQQQLAQSDIKF